MEQSEVEQKELAGWGDAVTPVTHRYEYNIKKKQKKKRTTDGGIRANHRARKMLQSELIVDRIS